MVNYEQILSARVKEVQPSGIRRFFELAAKMPHAISLGVGVAVGIILHYQSFGNAQIHIA